MTDTNRQPDFDDGMKAGIFYLMAYPAGWMFLTTVSAVNGLCWWIAFTFDGWERWAALGFIALRVVATGRKWVDEFVERAYLSAKKREEGASR